jgi:acyl-CoA synthetase (AMP-forming)/AMP-acid ligase II/acyl carrier protein
MECAGHRVVAATSFRTLPDLLREAANRFPGRIAIDAPACVAPLDYARLEVHNVQSAERLAALGIRRGDRVAVVLDNGPEMATAFLAVTAAATCAPLNPAYGAAEFEFYLSDLQAKAVIVGRNLRSPAVDVAHSLGIAVIRLEPRPEAGAGAFTLELESTASGSTLIEAAAPDSTSSGSPGLPSPDDVALVLHTSGTTSRPKIVPLTHANLCRSAENVRRTLALTEVDRCLNVMPLFHIHGLVAATLGSLAAGGSIVCCPGFLAPEFWGWLDRSSPTWYTAVPTMHQAILARSAVNQDVASRRRLRFVRSSSAALPPTVMAELERVFQAPVIEAYGMTEAAHQMASNPLPPRTRKPGTVGVAAGPEIAIMGEAGTLLPPEGIGEIVIRGENVTPGYENNPEANAAAFVNGWFRTGDQGRLDADGYLTITGRLKEIINRGGEKISPREIDEVLLNHPAVAQAVTFGFADHLLGEEIAAAVVLQAGGRATEAELREFAESQLAYFKVPARILILNEIPKGPTGKVQRIGLAEKLGVSAAAPAPAASRKNRPDVPPRTDLEAAVAEIWSSVLRVDRVGVDEPFLELGGDSILAGRVAARVYERFAIELSLTSLFAAPTVAAMAEIVARKTAEISIHPDLERLVAEIESLSETEVERLLAEEAEL